MLRSYKSPAKVKRNLARLVNHLFKIINKNPKLSLTKPKNIEIVPIRTPELAKSLVSFTNYPDPCTICQLYQCSYNFNHDLVFSLSAALEESLVTPLMSSLNVALEESHDALKESLEESHDALKESLSKMWNRNPPDDSGG